MGRSIRLKQFLRKIASFFLLFFVVILSTAHGENLLKNGDFEGGLSGKIPKFWGDEYYNSSMVAERGGNAVKISNKTAAFSLGAQEITINPAKTPKLTLSAYVKLDGVVAGKEDWNKANIQLLFFDKKGVQVGGWPELGKWDGTFDWKKVTHNFIVPKEAVKAKIIFGLYDCVGSAFFDDITLYPMEDQRVSDPYNLIQGGDFELWEKWAYGGSTDWGIDYSSPKIGVAALRIKNTSPVWSFASQSVSIDGAKVKKIKLSGYVKANNVSPGVKPWQLARVNIEFKDGKGKRIGGWPILDAFSGTFDWKYVEQAYDVPENTKRVDVFAGLLECAGEAYFDDLKLIGYDKSGKKIKLGNSYATNTKGWYKFDQKYSTTSKKSPIDVSFLLDKPAGKHGFLGVKNGKFYFEDGTRARFLGTNVVAPSTFLSKPDAEKMAKRLASMGCNLVRIHHIDAFWSNPNIFDNNFDDTQHISAEVLDKLDYLIYQLKKNGVYVFMDLLVDREFKQGDGVADWKNVERGAKITGLFDPKVIELQKKYATQILTHTNPYTGLRYVDDPVVVSVKLINEAMFFYMGTYFNLSPYYLTELDTLFNNWLLKKYGSRDALQSAWTDRYGRNDLEYNEDPDKGTVKRADIPLRYQRSGGEKREPFRVADTLKFYEELQNKYFKEMGEYVKGLGVKVPISGSNHWVNVWADVRSNATLDYIDRHRYWDHPQFGYGTQIVFENQSMLKNPADALPNNFAFYRVKDKPFVISEWNTCFPNEYRVEGPLFMTAYSNFQDWDGILQFSFNNPDWKAPMEDNFDISAWPNIASQWAIAALMFYRGDVAVAREEFNYPVPEKELYGSLDEDAPIASDPYIPYLTKTSINFDSKFHGTLKEFDPLHNKASKKLVSDTKELRLDYAKGIFTIDTKRTQGVIGFSKGEMIKLSNMIVKSNTPFSSIAISSLTGLPLSKTKKALLVASARIENSGQKYNESKTQLTSVGAGPLLVEGVSADIKLNRKIKSVKALDVNGNVVKKVKISGGSFKIMPADKAFFYVLEF